MDSGATFDSSSFEKKTSFSQQPVTVKTTTMFESRDSDYINLLRGGSVIRVMLGHLGLTWFWPPYSYFITALLPILFFVSGAISFQNYLKRPFGTYLYKRIIGLWIPFFLLTIPVALIFSARSLSADPISLTSWLLLWPVQSLFPFPIGQIWFINVLLLLVICSALVFPILRRSRTEWFAAGLMGFIFLTLILDKTTIVSFFRAWPVFDALRLPGQMHQTFIFAQFYFWGAFYYKNPNLVSRSFLAAFCLLTLLPGLFLSFLNLNYVDAAVKNITDRNANYILLAHGVISALLLSRDALLSLINRIVPLKALLLFANRNSYALFLLHTPVLFVIERSLNMENLSGNLPMALIRLLLVIIITMLLSLPFTILSRLITTNISKIWFISVRQWHRCG